MIALVETRAYSAHRTVVVDDRDGVWLTFCRPWHDVRAWLWWALTPGRMRWLVVTVPDGDGQTVKARVRAKRVSRNLVRTGGVK